MFDTRRNALIFLTLAVILAVIAGVMFVNQVQAFNDEMGEMTAVLVAAHAIPARVPLSPSDFEERTIPTRFAPASLVTDRGGTKGTVSVLPLAAGDVLTKNMLKPVAGSTKGEDSRQVRIMTSDRIQFDSALAPLDRVDIVVSHRLQGAAKTEVFMRDVEVANVFRMGGGGREAPSGTSVAPEELAGIAVDVTVEDGRRLIEMENYADSIRVLKAANGQAVDIAAGG